MARFTTGGLNKSYRQERRLFKKPSHYVVLVIAVALLILLPQIMTTRSIFGIPLTDAQLLGIGQSQINLVLISIMGAVALNLLVGYTGLISLGHAAFFAVGAAAAGYFGVQLHLPFLLVLLLAGVAGAVVGLLIGLPSLRLKGLYLMLATLALHFVVLYLFLQYQLKFFTPAGISYLPPSIGPININSDGAWYWLLLIFAALLLFGLRNFMRTRQGRSFIAVRDHDIAAASLGMNVPMVRLRAFAVSSFIVAVVGALFAYNIGNVADGSFTLDFVIGYFAMIIIGGMGSTTGAVFGAILWVLLPQVLQTASVQVSPDTPFIGPILSTYQGQIVSIILGILIILILRFKPGGLNGYWQALKGMVQQWPYRK
jgi:branched-chain amino acid transport system permease protein